MIYPVVTIITVVFNASSTLETTIKSVIDQQKELFEYWIIDGGSTDGSLDIIKKYEHLLAGWISEPDKGIFDAMNKGVDKSSGDWLYFLGADDSLQPDIIKQIYPYLSSPYKVVYGDVLCSNNYIFRSFLGPRTLLLNTLHHQGTFYNRSLFKNFKYDQSLLTQADYELNLRVYLQRLSTKYIPLLVSTYALGGSSAGHTDKSYKEINQIRARYLKGRLKNTTLTFLLRLYYWQKQLRSWLYGHQL